MCRPRIVSRRPRPGVWLSAAAPKMIGLAAEAAVTGAGHRDGERGARGQRARRWTASTVLRAGAINRLSLRRSDAAPGVAGSPAHRPTSEMSPAVAWSRHDNAAAGDSQFGRGKAGGVLRVGPHRRDRQRQVRGPRRLAGATARWSSTPTGWPARSSSPGQPRLRRGRGRVRRRRGRRRTARLDRAALGGVVFADAGRLARAQGDRPPAGRGAGGGAEAAAPADAVVVNDVPLLVENDLSGALRPGRGGRRPDDRAARAAGRPAGCPRRRPGPDGGPGDPRGAPGGRGLRGRQRRWARGPRAAVDALWVELSAAAR